MSATETRVTDSGGRPDVRDLLRNPVVLAGIVAVLLFVVGNLLVPGFGSYGTVMNVLRVAAFLGVIAAGQTIVILAGGEGIDLSVGKIATFSAIVVAQVSGGEDGRLLLAVATALLFCGLVGVVNGVGVAYLRIPPLVMTLGMVAVVQGIIRVYSGGQPEGRAPAALSQLVNARTVLGIRGSVWIWLIIAVGVVALLRRTTFGRRVYALGANRETAYLSGINVQRNLVLVYVASSLFAALGGVMLIGYSGAASISLADQYQLISIAAVVIGGTTLAGGVGGYLGTVIGAVVLQALTSLLVALNIGAAGRQIVNGLILIVLLSAYGRQRRLRQ
ncbi:ABC transporter permease [Egicoccus halophilus]|uniref:Sugar ABC transporter permease n=1 Tax=Egicoccus halophilus TaxID=1670830 RepID=A0A8J3ESP8_9ACTN|nr:ABC transporter permease [Egicoccus halophilus]GGI03471.1 sugar ABC transporter permease [Egicoccus halophilus]